MIEDEEELYDESLRDRGIRATEKERRILYAMLIAYEKYSFLPELFDALDEDPEKMFNVLTIFEGMKITFPKLKEMTKILDNIRIYARINAVAKKGRTIVTGVVEELAVHHGIDEKEVRTRYRNVRKIMRESGIRI